MPSTPSAALDTNPRKRPPPETPRLVTLSVVCQVQKKLTFKIKGGAPLKKLVDIYFGEVPMDRRTVDFIYNGKRLDLQLTPDQLGMDDVDEIEMMTRSQGGGNLSFTTK